MSMNDPISDLLTRIRNATRARQEVVEIPASRIKEQICAVLKAEGYIDSYRVVEDAAQGRLQVKLRYSVEGAPVMHGIRRVSRPSLRVYVSCDEIRPVRSGLGVSILTTSKGVMTGRRARTEKLGGEVLCEVW